MEGAYVGAHGVVKFHFRLNLVLKFSSAVIILPFFADFKMLMSKFSPFCTQQAPSLLCW